MRLRDRLSAALQTFREAPDLRSRLDTVEYELKLADQALELKVKECSQLRDTIEDRDFQIFRMEEEKDSAMRFLSAKSDALLEALRAFPPRLSATEEMKQFYDAVASSLDPNGFTLYRMAQEVSGMDVTGLFPYEDARGMFEEASGHQLMNYLTAYLFSAVEWEIVPGTTYESASLGEVDTTAPEYRQFERQLYERVLERMGFGEFLLPEEPQQTAALEQQTVPQPSAMTMT